MQQVRKCREQFWRVRSLVFNAKFLVNTEEVYGVQNLFYLLNRICFTIFRSDKIELPATYTDIREASICTRFSVYRLR